MKKHIAILTCIMILLLTLTGCRTQNIEEEGEFRIVSSFYPTYIMLVNITQGVQNVEIENMSSTNTGCLHDYTLTTTDLKKLEDADVFITSGVENFMNNISATYPDLQIIDSIANAPNSISDEHGINNHMWLDISNYISQVKIIAKQLSQINPENESIYEENSNAYIQALEEIRKLGKRRIYYNKKMC